MDIGAAVVAFPTQVQLVGDMQALLSKDCPSCQFKEVDVPVTSIGTNLPSLITSFLTANPDIQWMYGGFDDMLLGLPTALQGADLNPKLVAVSLDSATVPYLSGHEFLQAANGVTLPEVYWREIDLLARYFTHKSYAIDTNDATLPYWTITASNLPGNASSVTFANVRNYAQQFKKIWGLG
jgi:ribose transport system substrate-binding protein